MSQIDVALLTEDRYERLETGDSAVGSIPEREPNGGMPEWYVRQILHEDALLREALERRGLRVERLPWSRDIDWSRFRCAVFRTTWDYSWRSGEFDAWLQRASRATRLLNSLEIVRWNLDKRYLSELPERGVNAVPQHVVETGEHVALLDILVARDWKEAVVKPVVSAAGRDTFRVDHGTAAELEERFQECLEREAMMVQPFQASILEDGELSLIVIDGVTTHAVRKLAKQGEFRVQDDHGGTVHEHVPTAEESTFAEAAARVAIPENAGEDLLYARVDVVRDAGGALSVMELELVEPELFLRFHPPAAEALAAGIEKRLSL